MMRYSTRFYTRLLLAVVLIIPAVAQSTGFVLYSSSLANLGSNRTVVTLRGGIGDTDDIAGTFFDSDGDMMADGFILEALSQGNLQGSQTHTFAAIEVDGVTLLGFPIVQSNGFPLTPNSVLPSVPPGALPLVPITPDGRIVVSRQNGQSIVSFPLLIDPELISDALFDDSFELPVPPVP